MSKRQTIILRADAGTEMGTGHVMRCLALAQRWRDRGGDAVLLTASELGAISDRFAAEKVRVLPIPSVTRDAELCIRTAKECGAKWIVVDGYHFRESYVAALKSEGNKVLAIQDYPLEGGRVADAILDANSYASFSDYGGQGSGKSLLIGARYALLRREFSKWRDWTRDHSTAVKHLLVTLGGADEENVTLKVVNAVRELPGQIETVVVVGAKNRHLSAITEAAAHSSTIRIERNSPDMAALMAWADLAVSGAGTTVWEMAFMQLPALLLVVAKNQERVAADTASRGVTVSLGSAGSVTPQSIRQAIHELMLSPESRQLMGDKGRQLVDGGGAERVCAFLSGETAI